MVSLHAPRLALALLLLLAQRGDAVWTPFVNMTQPFVLNDVSKCAPVTHQLTACLAIARTLAPSRFSERLQVDEQSVPENICTHATFDQLAEGARRFGVQPCLASAANAATDTGVLFLLMAAPPAPHLAQ
jgi:hypothetical protein